MNSIVQNIGCKRRISPRMFFFILAVTLGGLWGGLSSNYFDIRANPNKKVIVVFRNDDIQEYVGSQQEQNLFKVLEENRIPQTYALVPFKYDLTQKHELLAILRRQLKAGLAEIALHGYRHDNQGKETLKTEFLGRSFVEQNKEIAEGKAYLENLFDIKINTFIPPFNSYDLNTVNAFQQNDVAVLSSSVFYHYRYQNALTIVNPNYTLTSPMLDDIKLAQHHGPDLSIFIMYYHSHMADIYASDDYYGRMKAIIDYIIQQDNVDVMTLGEVALAYPNYFRERYSIDIWRGRADILLRFFKQDKFLTTVRVLNACGYLGKLKLFSILSVIYMFGLFFLGGGLVGIVLNLITAHKGILGFLSVAGLGAWGVAITLLSSDARLGMLDVGLLICVLGFVSNTILVMIKKNIEDVS